MDQCCETDLSTIRHHQGRVLKAVLAINIVMFFVEIVAGIVAGSTALMGDSLDMLGDSLVYGFSLYVLHRTPVWRVRAAVVKGVVMVAFAVAVLVDAAFKIPSGVAPVVPIMLAIGGLALGANAFCFVLLWRHRSDDINMRSTWLCSRNDLIANSTVIVAAILVGALSSPWPDIVAGVGIAALFLRTAVSVFSDSIMEFGRVRTGEVESAG